MDLNYFELSKILSRIEGLEGSLHELKLEVKNLLDIEDNKKSEIKLSSIDFGLCNQRIQNKFKDCHLNTVGDLRKVGKHDFIKSPGVGIVILEAIDKKLNELELSW